MAKFHVADEKATYCCFSLDSRLIAAAAGDTVYIWNITSPDPHLIETFVGHTDSLKSLVFSFPSSLISVSGDRSVKFWQIDISSMGLGTVGPQFMPPTSTRIEFISLQGRDGIAISSDLAGVVKT